MSLMEPFAVRLALEAATAGSVSRVVRRYLSDMRGMYLDVASTEARLAENPLIYEVYEISAPEETGQLQSGVTILYPGKVGDEYFMTSGHFHLQENTAEVYLGLRGEGHLLMQSKAGEFRALKMEPGTIVYVPPYWGHRTVNTGRDTMTFFFVYPGDAGHDYGTIEQKGFVRLLVERDGIPTFIDNPRFT
jgi:glucose-6-phosphate isomerase